MDNLFSGVLLVWRAMLNHKIRKLYNRLPMKQLRFPTNWAILQ